MIYIYVYGKYIGQCMRVVMIHSHYIWIIIFYECNYYLLGTIVKDNDYNVIHTQKVGNITLVQSYISVFVVCTDSECSFICFCVIILNRC